MRHAHIAPGGRYPVLRTVAILWLVGAAISCAAGIFQAICALVPLRDLQLVDIGGLTVTGRVMGFFMWLAATFFFVVMNIAVAELIKLMIDLEHNTRMTAMNTAGAATAPRTEPEAARTTNGREIEEESAEVALIRGH